MNSISIVYKKPKAKKEFERKIQQPNDLRKAVHEYYNKLLEKGDKKSELIEKIRSQTARASKLMDRKKVFSSLNIVAIPTPQPALKQKSTTQKQLPKPSIFHVRRTKQNFFTLRLPENEHHIAQHPSTRHLSRSSNRHSKLKILMKPKCKREATLIMSVDFIYNEFNFWSEENVEEACVKTWKMLSSLANIIWIVRRESTFRKLVAFAQTFHVPIDGVVQIEPNKKEPLLISYQALEHEMKLLKSHKLLIINCLKSGNKQNFAEYQFRNSLPIISHQSASVHFARIQMNNPHRFAVIKDIVSKDLPQPFDMRNIFKAHQQLKGKNLSCRNVETECQKTSALEELQNIKQRLCTYFGQSMGLTKKIEGDSIQFIVGDMLRRNYGIARQYYSYCDESKERGQGTQVGGLQGLMGKSCCKIEYNIPVYIWKF